MSCYYPGPLRHRSAASLVRQSTGTGPCVAGLVAGAGWLQVHREMAGREMKCREMKFREMEFLHIGAFATQSIINYVAKAI